MYNIPSNIKISNLFFKMGSSTSAVMEQKQ